MVLGAGGAHEHRRALAVVGEHLESERLGVERGGAACIAHVQHRVVESSHSRSHMARNPLSRSTIPGNTSTNRSTSAGVDDQPTDTRSDRSASTPMASQHRRRFERLRRARRAGVHGHAVLIQGEQDRLGLDAADAEAQHVGERPVAEPFDVGDRVDDDRGLLDQGSLRGRLRGEVDDRARRAEAHPRGHVLDTAPPGPFLRPADESAAAAAARGVRAARPRPSGPPSLCAVTEQRSAPSAPKSTVDVTRGRARVDVHEYAPLAQSRAHLGNRLHGSDLVVRELHADQARCRARTASTTAPASNRPKRSTPTTVTVGRAARDRVAHARMLDRGRDHDAGEPRAQRADHRGVDGLGTRRREHDLARPGAEEGGNLLARRLQRDPRARALPRATAPGRRTTTRGTGASRRTRRAATEKWKRDRGTNGSRPRRRPARQTRVTQCWSPSGRLSVSCGCVSP